MKNIYKETKTVGNSSDDMIKELSVNADLKD